MSKPSFQFGEKALLFTKGALKYRIYNEPRLLHRANVVSQRDPFGRRRLGSVSKASSS